VKCLGIFNRYFVECVRNERMFCVIILKFVVIQGMQS
jgi:hypothetical protein